MCAALYLSDSIHDFNCTLSLADALARQLAFCEVTAQDSGIVHSGSEKWVFPAPILDEAKYRLDMAGLSDEST